MIIDIHAQHFSLTQAIKDHVNRSLSFALDRLEESIDQVSVHLCEENSTGHQRRTCKIIAKTNTVGMVIINESLADMYDAIDHAVKRLKFNASKKLDKSKRINRQLVLN